ncbi:MAG: amino acid ABC transporter ATP-binding protein, partial [Cyanobacteria bacterium REEB65]|nr:amino acid ABC transporter ATP-binding protein [Cyanobacteria bacterium REEB65]
GEKVVLLGPSGSGKSTLLRCINRLEEVDSGRITVSGRIITQAEKREVERIRADVGMVFQAFNLFAHLTVLENICLAPMTVRKVPKTAAEATAKRLLERVGLAHKADVYPAQLSGGQQQRVAIARALAMEPEIMLFDEPTSALDPEMVHEVLQVINDIAAKGLDPQNSSPVTMLIVTHEMGFARKVADRVLFMADGHIVEDAPPRIFFNHPQTDRARAFLAHLERRRADTAKLAAFAPSVLLDM